MLMMRNLLHFPLPGVQPQLAQRLEHHRTEIVRQRQVLVTHEKMLEA
jgi:hypothetical protein